MICCNVAAADLKRARKILELKYPRYKIAPVEAVTIKHAQREDYFVLPTPSEEEFKLLLEKNNIKCSELQEIWASNKKREKLCLLKTLGE